MTSDLTISPSYTTYYIDANGTACFMGLMLSDTASLLHAVSPGNSPSQDPSQWLFDIDDYYKWLQAQ